MYREVIKVDAHSKKEALINLGHALKEVLGCKNDSHIFTRVLVPDENGDIEDSEVDNWFQTEEPLSGLFLFFLPFRTCTVRNNHIS